MVLPVEVRGTLPGTLPAEAVLPTVDVQLAAEKRVIEGLVNHMQDPHPGVHTA
jgi:hypothetical protein